MEQTWSSVRRWVANPILSSDANPHVVTLILKECVDHHDFNEHNDVIEENISWIAVGGRRKEHCIEVWKGRNIRERIA